MMMLNDVSINETGTNESVGYEERDREREKERERKRERERDACWLIIKSLNVPLLEIFLL